jgi:AraC-like DNA-binding protein
MNYVIAIGLFQALLTMMLLQIGKKRRPAGSLILGLLTCVFTHLALKFFIYAVTDYTVLKKEFNTFIGLAYGPVLWMIARKIRDDHYVPARQWFLLLPAMAGAVCYLGIVLYIVTTGHEPMLVMTLYNNITLVLILCSGIAYPIAAYRHTGNLSSFRNPERKLIRHLSLLFLLMALAGISGVLARIWPLPPGGLMVVIRIISYSLLLFVCIIILSYLLLPQLELKVLPVQESAGIVTVPAGIAAAWEEKTIPVSGTDTSNTTADPGIEKKETLVRSTLPESQQRIIVEQLEALMQSRKYYTDPDIDLEQLSAIAHISRHHISEALNQYAHKTFYQFLNEYRIREILQMLDKCKSSDVRPNILSLAFEVGFNSKSSFNLYFKKSTGLTPSEYLKRGKES